VLVVMVLSSVDGAAAGGLPAVVLMAASAQGRHIHRPSRLMITSPQAAVSGQRTFTAGHRRRV
jgi:ATP-dependent protease ClpP protease subunit